MLDWTLDLKSLSPFISGGQETKLLKQKLASLLSSLGAIL